MPESSANLNIQNLVIIGGGPAALAAAIYAARAGVDVTVYEKAEFGGILTQIPQLDNYPGFSGSGQDLATQMRTQAIATGAKLEYGECLTMEAWPGPTQSNHIFRLTIDDVETQSVFARAVLVASGSQPRTLSFTPNAPVSYCALCDGPLVQGKHIAVVGGANSAIQEALYLARLAQDVTIITHSQLKADQQLITQLSKYSNIKVIEHLEPTSQNLAEFDHIFVYIGKRPNTGFIDKKLLDNSGYIITDTSSQSPHQTVTQGLFAAGDVRSTSVQQVVTAAADGAAAAIEISQYIHNNY